MPKAKSFKTLLILVISFAILMLSVSCKKPSYNKYSYETTKAFDTVISFVGYETSKAQFDKYTKQGETRLLQMDKLFDIYHSYTGIVNLKTINEQAIIAPVKVSVEIIELLKLSKKYELITNHKVNIAMGAVLKLWHDSREAGLKDPQKAAVPDQAKLTEAALHCDINKLIIDEKTMTVFLADPLMSLDVGAVAKGYATEVVGDELEKAGLKSCIISAGGSNVKLIGAPLDGKRKNWGVGIQNPDADTLKDTQQLIDTAFLNNTSFVTSGDYQRYYFVGEKRYSHIIDPVTLFPADNFRAVSVLYKDSAVADLFSTALFIMTYEEGLAFAKKTKGLEAVWIFPDDHLEATAGLKASLKVLGNATGD